MSAKRMTDTKVPEDHEQDSGFLSGPIDQLPGDSGELSSELSGEIKSDSKNVPSVSVESEFDSGVVVLTDELLQCKLEPTTTVVLQPPKTETKASSTLPPLSVLFKQDDDGDTQLHIAAIHGCEKAVGTLIKICPNKEWFNVPNDDGHTALHLAVMSGNAVVTRMLVIAGASLTVRNRKGETPLHKATALKNVECIKALLNPVKELPQRQYSTILNQKNYNGQACVHVAAASGHVDTLQALVYYGADINSRENLGGWTALHVAVARGQAGAVSYLVSRCAAARDYAGRTPRRLARHRPALRRVFDALAPDSDSDTDDDDEYDSDNETLFEKLRDTLNPTLVA